jgi:4-hydroxybenzoate polyprenyltransferase
LNSRIHVAALPSLITLFWQTALPFKLPWHYYVMITANTMTGYLINLRTDRTEDRINLPAKGWVPAETWRLKLVIWCCGLLSFFLAFAGGWKFVLFGGVLNFLGTVYGMRFRLRGGRTLRIKGVAWLKNAYSAGLWAIGVIILPYVYSGAGFDVRTILACVATFFMVFFVELLWDVRDVRGDRAAELRTIPLCFGEFRARQILHVTNVLSSCILLGGVLSGLFPTVFWAALPNAIVVAIFIEWYFERANRQSASHLYLLYNAGMMFLTMALFKLRRYS